MKRVLALSSLALLVAGCGSVVRIEIANRSQNLAPALSTARQAMLAVANGNAKRLANLLSQPAFDKYMNGTTDRAPFLAELTAKVQRKQIKSLMLNSSGTYLDKGPVSGSIASRWISLKVDVYAMPSQEKLGTISLQCAMEAEAWAILWGNTSQLSSCKVEDFELSFKH